MVSRTVQKIVCCLIVVTMPAALMAAETGSAMVTAKGSYTVNGEKGKNSAVMAGDAIATAAKSEAVIRTKSSAVVLPESSAVVYGNNRVQLTSGQLMVMTKSGMTVAVGDVNVRPANKSARFEVSEINGVQRVAALEGDLVVTNGTQSYTLASGKQMTRSLRAAAPQGGAGVGPGPWAIGLAVAAVVTGITVGLVTVSNDEDTITAP